MYKCTKCSNIFSTNQRLKTHINKKNKCDDYFLCEICNTKFNNKKQYQIHKKTPCCINYTIQKKFNEYDVKINKLIKQNTILSNKLHKIIHMNLNSNIEEDPDIKKDSDIEEDSDIMEDLYPDILCDPNIKQNSQNITKHKIILDPKIKKRLDLTPDVVYDAEDDNNIDDIMQDGDTLYVTGYAEEKADNILDTIIEKTINKVVEYNYKPKLDTKVQPKLDIKVQPKLDIKVQPKLSTKVQPKLDDKGQPKLDNKGQPKLDTKVQPKLDNKGQPKLDTKVQPKLDTNVQPKSDNKGPSKLNTKVQPKSDNKGPSKLDTKVQLKLDTKVQPKLDTKVQPVQPKSDNKGPPKSDDKGPPKLDDKGPPKLDDKGPPKLDDKGQPKLDHKGQPKLDNKGPPKLDAKVQPKLDNKYEHYSQTKINLQNKNNILLIAKRFSDVILDDNSFDYFNKLILKNSICQGTYLFILKKQNYISDIIYFIDKYKDNVEPNILYKFLDSMILFLDVFDNLQLELKLDNNIKENLKYLNPKQKLMHIKIYFKNKNIILDLAQNTNIYLSENIPKYLTYCSNTVDLFNLILSCQLQDFHLLSKLNLDEFKITLRYFDQNLILKKKKVSDMLNILNEM